ncbi:MAG: hypothetical protein OXJ53_18910 [Gammaproteobacteria bacterium]|nr:hypothetical protein [Gammaproteobacteria bacterium]MDE0273110.1 hypothetical protein [Gammaproteobacteria bacterium]
MSLLGSLLQEAHEQGRNGDDLCISDSNICRILKEEKWPQKCFQSVKDMILKVNRTEKDAHDKAKKNEVTQPAPKPTPRKRKPHGQNGPKRR